MTEGLHPLAPHHAPFFFTAPGQTDALLVGVGIFLLSAVVGIGILYFKLHALPEHMAHKGQKVQFEIVAVLGLLALFTHNHLFWVAGLLLALVPFPDFVTPLTSMAQSLGKMSDRAVAGPPKLVPLDPAPPPVDDAPRREAPLHDAPLQDAPLHEVRKG
jgi:hypothetical protein